MSCCCDLTVITLQIILNLKQQIYRLNHITDSFNVGLSLSGTRNYFVSTVCLKKNIPDIFSCNFRKHCRIFIMFVTRVTEKVSNQ